MHHTYLSLLLPTALYAAALSLGAPVQAATPAPLSASAWPQAAPLSAARVALRRDRHGARRPFALLPPSGRAG